LLGHFTARLPGPFSHGKAHRRTDGKEEGGEH